MIFFLAAFLLGIGIMFRVTAWSEVKADLFTDLKYAWPLALIVYSWFGLLIGAAFLPVH